MLDRLGTVEAGKVAHLILVDGDPPAGIGALRRVRHVLEDGVRQPLGKR